MAIALCGNSLGSSFVNRLNDHEPCFTAPMAIALDADAVTSHHLGHPVGTDGCNNGKAPRRRAFAISVYSACCCSSRGWGHPSYMDMVGMAAIASRDENRSVQHGNLALFRGELRSQRLGCDYDC